MSLNITTKNLVTTFVLIFFLFGADALGKKKSRANKKHHVEKTSPVEKNSHVEKKSSLEKRSPANKKVAETKNSHFIKNGEILSRVARQHFGAPTYTKRGALEKILKLNPQIKNADVVLPGQKIKVSDLPDRSIASADDDESEFHTFPHSTFSISPSFYYSVINGKEISNGTKATFISRVNYHLGASWSQKWTRKFQTNLFGSLRREDYYSTSTITLQNTALVQGEFGLGFKYKLFDQLSILSSVSYSQETFYRAHTPTVLSFDSIALPTGTFGLDFRIFRISQYDLNFKVDGWASLPWRSATYDLKMGKGYRTTLEFSEKMVESRNAIGCEIYYGYLKQDSSLVAQSKKELGAGCAFKWSLGGMPK